MAVRARVQLRHLPETRIFRLPVGERREAALADRLIAVRLRLVGLVDRARAYVLSSQIESVADLVLDPKAPLHEVRRMELAVRNRGDGNRREAGVRIRQRRGAGELALREARIEELIRRRGRIDGAVRNSWRDRDSSHRAEQPALKGLRVGRIRSHEIDHAARQDVAEQAEPAAQHRVRRELPGDGGSRLQDRGRRGGENRPLLRPNDLAQRLIHIVRNGIERPGEARHGVMRIQRI